MYKIDSTKIVFPGSMSNLRTNMIYKSPNGKYIFFEEYISNGSKENPQQSVFVIAYIIDIDPDTLQMTISASNELHSMQQVLCDYKEEDFSPVTGINLTDYEDMPKDIPDKVSEISVVWTVNKNNNSPNIFTIFNNAIIQFESNGRTFHGLFDKFFGESSYISEDPYDCKGNKPRLVEELIIRPIISLNNRVYIASHPLHECDPNITGIGYIKEFTANMDNE